MHIRRAWDPLPPRWKLKCNDWLSSFFLGPVAARRIRHVQPLTDLGQTVPGDSEFLGKPDHVPWALTADNACPGRE